MKDSIALLATAVVMAFLAWLFWSSLGQDAFAVLGALMVVVLFVDNARLRRQVKALQAGKADRL
ncbi:hypothetical protein [Pseudomonas syringae]|uniref:Uncharacterized protein n=2 Tax=Pseudomonas syringae group TaxID=136849 RepID=A0A9Q4A686_PSESX|nr:hypothetical protein [Pseudomonas syringae]KTB71837.1 hypothetical protein AO067_05395 [Pseudomonas viridiflava ICMP 13104]MCF5468152.1 hypothetical protein [Pseudomonas syringae]MCF5473305.1 hypothetical protein [Pseudomonas syringae]MCF5483320.1 hypothetical protein [Pseudomonas syringae]MCF5487272.1 hypothetical protein [Pseudomonas syringae]